MTSKIEKLIKRRSFFIVFVKKDTEFEENVYVCPVI